MLMESTTGDENAAETCYPPDERPSALRSSSAGAQSPYASWILAPHGTTSCCLPLGRARAGDSQSAGCPAGPSSRPYQSAGGDDGRSVRTLCGSGCTQEDDCCLSAYSGATWA